MACTALTILNCKQELKLNSLVIPPTKPVTIANLCIGINMRLDIHFLFMQIKDIHSQLHHQFVLSSTHHLSVTTKITNFPFHPSSISSHLACLPFINIISLIYTHLPTGKTLASTKCDPMLIATLLVLSLFLPHEIFTLFFSSYFLKFLSMCY